MRSMSRAGGVLRRWAAAWVRSGRLGIFLGLSLFGGAALACPVCAPTTTLTPAQVLINADRALLVSADATGRLRIESVISGPGASGDRLDLSVPASQAPRRDGKPVLMVRDGLSREWSALAEVDAAHAPLLQSFTQLKRTSEMGAADWQQRVAQFVPLLEHPEPLIAQTAYGEVARSPYAAMRANRSLLDAAQLRQWVNDTQLTARRPLYLLLLGLAGAPDDAQSIERQLTGRGPRVELVDLPALVAADLELRGPARLPWIEQQILLDPKRSASEVQAALVALSVHGNEGARVPRERVIETYLRLIRDRPPLAGLVAQDLASWQVWDATPAYAALIERSDVPMASRVAMVQYLRVSPHPQARIALQRLTPSGQAVARQ